MPTVVVIPLGGRQWLEQPALWSADSTRLLTVLRDKRQVLTLPMIDHVPSDGSIRPILHSTKVGYPGDKQVETFQFLAIDVTTSKICTPNHPPLITGLNHNWGVFFAKIAWWGQDNRHAYFIALEQGDQMMNLVEFDTHTGTTRVLFEEASETYINIMTSDYMSPSAHRYLASSNELLWWSERSGWGHLYLYDLNTGELKRQITGEKPSASSDSEWSVREVLHVDEQRREILIQTAGRVAGRDPYYRDICRVQIDTGEITTVYSSDEDTCVHYPESIAVYADNCTNRANAPTSGISPNGDYIVLTRSRVDRAPVTQLLSRGGETILELEVADIGSLPTGWTWPEPVQVKAADGTSPLYGVLFRPSNFSPDKKYPVINHISGSPWMSMVPKGSFNSARSWYTNMHYFHGAALAELGFIVLQLDSRGTALRGKAFQDESYGWIAGANNSEDHAGAIQQLAKRYPSMDINRVGSFCIAYQSGLINFLECQDLYKVHVQGHLYEERLMGICTGDTYNGCEGPIGDKKNAEDLVNNLQGKLLLMHACIVRWLRVIPLPASSVSLMLYRKPTKTSICLWRLATTLPMALI